MFWQIKTTTVKKNVYQTFSLCEDDSGKEDPPTLRE